ncbi:hypothetical protein [Streptomyces sp. ISL-100]|uniref:hypothetical protein n=1 Tax=Streptomyces sp. ISL-100 TaxID=2819173 RepID=UPI001BE7D6E3|nr:hypothetical protein [Streptomyces sp. ISL-100]MBT2399769.1 hypothetical protein [Streptomyces sp. ISL-100]
MNPLTQGSRRWRLLVNWMYGAAAGLGGVGALITGVVTAAANDGAFTESGTPRDHVVGVLAMLFLAAMCLDLAYRRIRDALFLHRVRRAEDADVTQGFVAPVIYAYGTISAMALASVATAVPLWATLLIVVGPPLVLLGSRAPGTWRVWRGRQAARAAAREAARPVVSTRNPRATRRTSRAQRRGAS